MDKTINSSTPHVPTDQSYSRSLLPSGDSLYSPDIRVIIRRRIAFGNPRQLFLLFGLVPGLEIPNLKLLPAKLRQVQSHNTVALAQAAHPVCNTESYRQRLEDVY